MNKISRFYHNKRVFLTGHTGFKGAWMAMMLSKMGAKVCGYSLDPEDLSLFNLVGVEKHCEQSAIGDIRDYDGFEKAYLNAKPDVVFHLAAQPLVLKSYQNPKDTIETNVIGTTNLFEIIRNNPLHTKAIVNITSDKCYENREWVWPYRENEAMGGYDPYSASKGMAEILTSSYRRSFFNNLGISLSSCRGGNVIGGGDFGEARIIPTLIDCIQGNKTLELRSPTAIRPWQHVLDVLSGYLTVGMASYVNQISDSFNVAPIDPSPICVEELIKNMISELKKGEYIIPDRQAIAHEAHFLKLDSTKIRSELGWQNCFTFHESIKLTAEWYDVYLSGDRGNLNQITQNQLNCIA